jgi:hypothetical protein
MRRYSIVIALFGLMLAGVVSADVATQERELIDRFLSKVEEKQTSKVSWMSGHFEINRINQQNDYNAFATNESARLSDASIPWLGDAKSLGLDMGLVFKDRFAWSVGGEYWLQLGSNVPGTHTYTTASMTSEVDDLKSQINVWGVTTGLHFYPLSHPSAKRKLTKLSLRMGGTIGYYSAKWDVWSAYESINLSTSQPESENIAFSGTGPGLSAVIGIDYPLGWNDFAIGLQTSYLHLNLSNVAWYNTNDEEIVASYNGSADGRVDLDLSGVRARIEIKRYFSW